MLSTDESNKILKFDGKTSDNYTVICGDWEQRRPSKENNTGRSWKQWSVIKKQKTSLQLHLWMLLATSRYVCERFSTTVSDVMDEIPQALEQREQISTNRNLSEQPTMRGGLPTCNETRKGMRFHRFGSDKNQQESNPQKLRQSICLAIPSLHSIRPILPARKAEESGFTISQETLLGSSCRLANATSRSGLGKNYQMTNLQNSCGTSQLTYFRAPSQDPARRSGTKELNRPEISWYPASEASCISSSKFW